MRRGYDHLEGAETLDIHIPWREKEAGEYHYLDQDRQHNYLDKERNH